MNRTQWVNRVACRLVGLGLWLAAGPRSRTPLQAVNFLLLGRWAVARLNTAWEQDELARRHAKPSSRQRVTPTGNA